MKVLVVIRANETYATQQAQIELVLGLKKKGVSILLMGEFSDEVLTEVKKLDLNYISLYPIKKIDKNYTKSFKKVVIEQHIDIVHFIDGKASRSGLPALKKLPIKVITYFGSISLHWYDPTSYLTYLHPRVDAIICNSKFVFNHVKKQLLPKHKHKPILIYKGYNSDWFPEHKPFNLENLGIPKSATVACFIGNHRKVKGTKYFLQSSYHLSSKKEIHYLLIGKNTDANDLISIAKKSPIANKIHILGVRSDVISLLKSTDIYVQTSLSEGFGRAISEAMSVAKPIVMTDAGGCTELIDKESGIIVPVKNPQKIAKAISYLSDNKSNRKEMGKKAKERINSVYHINNTINDTLSLYKKLLAKND
ncbi:glycosyltransferase involved in cell wall biosynthesis [Lutibacter sp. Hel_I_33_5]|uniref:glycosyltransferase family 4 protein n=1 Tax=Lutibacter sp. Hel_I_33_5 TaxID=1566289 RepID=UPI00119D8E05|nr:glycosyltransferase family 4 protein [Lutibacter sp. Hel_I_33_5]TVZ55384.1 glycosyltransferase involved in cell wall biosynthesis [Lutibacter sp. Hel_I_33_5]